MDNFNLNNYQRIYFCGILGVSMNALAKHCIGLNKQVCGSDVAVKKSTSICDGNITVNTGKNLKAIKSFKPDLVFYTSAINERHKELVYAKKQGVPVIGRAEFLHVMQKEAYHVRGYECGMRAVL